MTDQLHPDAERDLLDALQFYQQEAGRAVAARFIDAFEQATTLIAENPSLGASTNASRRSFPLRGFPYSVIYRPLETGIRILVVRHQHRHPTHGDARH
ncbi:hypothetical protein CKO42_15390 [Lamprobacter modestohalophilus]|uniref:Type II toxin-antitoxin system RelE/ParE family toxin n=1 Tax=Lamprobacter modestohalophilus TaxID=1064514 RepID=A0A9X1B5M6_9GAMM|nr:hypothetical protein [Lamprobacter modestohalophilus]